MPANIVVNISGEDPNPGHGNISFRDALAIANSNKQADTITFAPGITAVSITNAATLEISETGQANQLFIDGGGGVILQRVGEAEDRGGILHVLGEAFVEFHGLTFTGGNAQSGGALYVELGATATLTNVTVRGNTSALEGGGITNSGIMQLIDSTVIDNTGAAGGGIYSSGQLVLDSSTIANNAAIGNSVVGVDGSGGGIYATRGPIIDPPIPPNLPAYELLAFNSTISGNSASAAGGGVFVANTTDTLTNVTIANNRAGTSATGSGGGLFVSSSFTGTLSTITANNTIVSGNFNGRTGTTVDDVGGPGELASTSSHNLIGGVANLGPLADNGGPTLTHALLAFSPAINAGSNALAVDENGNPLTTDQRGDPRIFGGTVDIGAYELQQATGTAPNEFVAAGAGPGGPPRVNVYDSFGKLAYSFLAYDPAFRGGVSVAVADVNGDSVPDIITGAGPGGGPHVEVFDGTKLWMTQADGTLDAAALIASFYAYDAGFKGGVNVAAGDVGGLKIVTGAGAGGGPHVKVFGIGTEVFGGVRHDEVVQFASFYAYDPSFTGGVNVAVGDVNGDGTTDVITGAGLGGGPHVKVFDGVPLLQFGAAESAAVANPLKSFYAYSPSFIGGVTVAAGDVNGDGHVDIITGAASGGGPHVKVFDYASLSTLASFYAYAPNFLGGVRLATAFFNGGATMDIFTGPGPGSEPTVNVFSGGGTEVGSFMAFDPTSMGGVFVG